jgi:hypothetical protein
MSLFELADTELAQLIATAALLPVERRCIRASIKPRLQKASCVDAVRLSEALLRLPLNMGQNTRVIFVDNPSCHRQPVEHRIDLELV